MKKVICYNVDKIAEALPSSYKLRRIPCSIESEDWGKNSESLYFVHNSVEKVTIWEGTFGDSMRIYLNNGESYSAHSDNVNVDDKEMLRINSNEFISPELKFGDDNHVEATDKLTKWLVARGISKKTLKSFIETYEIYDTITYYGVPTPSKHHGCWGYSNADLELDEREIQTALNSIKDELLREKINCILYARVFKKR